MNLYYKRHGLKNKHQKNDNKSFEKQKQINNNKTKSHKKKQRKKSSSISFKKKNRIVYCQNDANLIGVHNVSVSCVPYFVIFAEWKLPLEFSLPDISFQQFPMFATYYGAILRWVRPQCTYIPLKEHRRFMADAKCRGVSSACGTLVV